MSILRDLIAAHTLRFERPERAPYPASAGTRLLIAFVLVGLVLQPTLKAWTGTALFAGDRWVAPAIVLSLLLAFIIALRGFVRVPWGAVGLHPWSAWTPRERIYFLTVAPAAAVAFAFMFREHFARLATIHGWAGLLAVTVPTGLLWGMVQEFIYRGILQTELTRRLGGIWGVLITNVVFTFGPLHSNYFGLGSDSGPRWAVFASIFAIGLVFGTLYRRSGNLWIPAVLHGLWPLNMT